MSLKAAIGFFDGFHRGHQAVVAGAELIVTFRNHPLSLLAPEKLPPLLMTSEERLAALAGTGKRMVVFDFDAHLAAMAPEEFLKLEELAEVGTIRGYARFRLGAGGGGTPARLRELGYAVEVVDDVRYQGEAISSSRIREAMGAGRLADAVAMLGRPFVVTGERFEGKHLGSELGYPTVNLQLKPARPLLPHGVYAVRVGKSRAVANYGIAPTCGAAAWPEPVLEVHFLSAAPAQVTAVELLSFLRPERRFASLAELRHQIARDIAAAGAG